MITLKELQQKYKIPRDEQLNLGWWGRYISSPLGVLLSKPLLMTSITPNQVTFLWLLTGLIGGVFFAFNDYWYSILAALLFQFVFVLDGVDGLIARYKKLSSVNGEYMESIAHTLVHDIFLMVGITIGVYLSSGNYLFIALGFSASISALLLKFISLERIHLFVKGKHYLKLVGKKKKAGMDDGGLIKKVYVAIMPLFKAYSLVNIAGLAAIFNRLDWYIIFYGISFPLLAIALLIYEFHRGHEWVGPLFYDE